MNRRSRRILASSGAVGLAASPAVALADTTSGSDPLATLVSGISFSTLETDIASVGVTLVALYAIWVGVKWVLKMVRSA